MWPQPNGAGRGGGWGYTCGSGPGPSGLAGILGRAVGVWLLQDVIVEADLT